MDGPRTSGKKNFFGYKSSSVAAVCCLASFLGWCVENAFRFFAAGVLDSRHRLFPFIPAYGVFVFAVFCCFGTPKDVRFFGKKFPKKGAAAPLVLYFCILYPTILLSELGVGLFLEKAFGVRAWDYSSVPLHLTRYTGLLTTFGFAALGTAFMAIFPSAAGFFDRRPRLTFPLVATLVCLIAIDSALSLFFLLSSGAFPEYWKFRFFASVLCRGTRAIA